MLVNRLFGLPGLYAGFWIALLFCSGCDSGKKSTPAEEVKPTRASFKDSEGLNTLIDPAFVPPKSAELDAAAKWEARPVVDALKRYAEYRAGLKDVPTVEAALKLRNVDDETNAKILAGMGRLPGDDMKADEDAVFNRRLKGDVSSTNPILANTIEEFDLQGLIGVTFFGFDWEMKPFASADYVKTWETSADGTMDKIVLRDDLVWSDGKPITAHDAAFSFRVLMNPDVPVLTQRSSVEDIKLVHAYDDRTLVYFHKFPLATNVWAISYPILPKHVYEKTWKDDFKLRESDAHRKLENEPVVGGPYKIAKRVSQQEILLERRPDYYEYRGKVVREKPYFKQIRMRIIIDPNTALLSLKKGDIDDLEVNMQQWQTQTGDDEFYAKNTKVRGVEWTYFYFGWNNRKPWFTDVKVRTALSYAFDHDELLRVQNYGLAQACVGPFHPESWMFPKDADLKPFKQDLEKADELLAEAGWDDTDGDGILDKVIDGKQVKFDFLLICVNDPTRVEACTLMKNNLAKLRIGCTVRPMELVALIDKTNKHEFDAYFGGWGTGTDPDTSENIFTTKMIDDGRNYICYSNRQVDGLYQLGKQTDENTAAREKVVKEYDLEKVGIDAKADRAKVYAKIAELIYRDQPGTFAYYRPGFFAFNRDLRGYKFSPRGPFHFSPGVNGLWKQAF